MGQLSRYNGIVSWVDCKSEGNILGVKKWLWGDVHLYKKRYNSFGHDLRKAGKHESNDIVGSNRDRSRDICEKKSERNSRANPQKPTTRVGRIAKERHKDPR